ncbi:MAG: nucleoside triphosphate pyrophosphohydrolase [Clostridia bacterium]|nr:nucleoside triphosphate pyrophosphohydrolase [Clostridia bacterium]
MKIFKKLVRDKIPDIIRENGETPTIRILDDEEYARELNKKLQEEVNEYIVDGNIEELADIEDVLRALVALKGVSYEDFDKMRESKCEKRGAFKDKVFLESTK